MRRQRRTLMMCSDCAHWRTTSRTCSLIDNVPVIVTPSILSAVTHSMPGRHGDRLKARLLWRLSVRSSSVNNVAACNCVHCKSAICSERNDVTSETELENRVWPFQKLKNRFYKTNPVLETVAAVVYWGGGYTRVYGVYQPPGFFWQRILTSAIINTVPSGRLRIPTSILCNTPLRSSNGSSSTSMAWPTIGSRTARE